ncbi:MAG: response regulator transcription factor [Campylobacterales bacterium]
MIGFEQLRLLTQELTLLYVEDVEEIREQMGHIFTALFKEVVFAANGEEGLARFGERGFDLVISDVMMPVMNGVQMCNRIKQIKPDQHVIIISASNEGQLVNEGLRVAVDGFILKPVISSQFNTALFTAARAITGRQ